MSIQWASNCAPWLVALVLSQAGCSVDAVSPDPAPNPDPTPGAVPTVEEVISTQVLTRDPWTLPPSPGESAFLVDQDVQFASGLVADPRWDEWLDFVTTSRDVDRLGLLFVAEDMRSAASVISNFSGGYAGHNFATVDGKFLEILYDLATWHGLNGHERGDFALAVDSVVAWHNQWVGPSPSFLYPEPNDGSAADLGQEAMFTFWLSAIVYHEFVHVWRYHQLRVLRQALGLSHATYSSEMEDEADRIAGMLLRARVGRLDGVGAREMLARVSLYVDLLTFYAMQRSPIAPIASFRELTEDFRFQFGQANPNYSSLVTRRALFLGGYWAMDAYLGPSP